MRIIAVILFFLSWTGTSAQAPPLSAVDYKKLSVNGVRLGSEKEVLLEEYGQPDTVLRAANEFEGTDYDIFVYGKSHFFISADKFNGFSIRDADFALDEFNICVGDDRQKLKMLFPVSFDRGFENENSTAVKVRIGATDSYVLFHCFGEKITEISTWDDL